MKCPHCTVEIHPAFQHSSFAFNGRSFSAKNAANVEVNWQYAAMICPACERAIIKLSENLLGTNHWTYIVPKAVLRPAAPTEVPSDLATDYGESCAVLADSPAASAALSRRCLQGILRSNGFNQKDLAPAIDALLASGKLPTELANSVDVIRNVGNFAAHPMKDTNTGAILPVEAEEAEWNLDVIEDLFDFFYVAPARAKAKRVAYNTKLATAGKPPLKQPPP